MMPAEAVRAAAQRTIDHIKGTRKARNDRVILYWMKKKAFSFRRGFYTRTYDEAVEYLDKHADFLGWRSQYAWDDLEKAYAFLRMTRLGEPITLNENDVRILFND